MRRTANNARRYNERVTLLRCAATADGYGHADIADASEVLEVWAEVRQMSQTKSLMTFQIADVVGLEIEFRTPPESYVWDALKWRGHEVHFSQPRDVDGRGYVTRIVGWYQQDDPMQTDNGNT